MVYTTFWLEHKLWGLAPLGYHLVNILLHAANVLLLWRLLLRLPVPGAWLIAAVFAVHPVHVESVAWIIERKDLLSALFYLTAVLTWIRFVEEPRGGLYTLALGLFTAGLLSKSVVITLPAALLIWQWWKYGRVRWIDLRRLAPFFAVGLIIAGADYSFYASREPLSLDYSLLERILIAAHALWFYVGKLLWPLDLAGIYPLWKISAGNLLAWTYVLGAAALVMLLWVSRKRIGRGPLAGVLFFAVTLSPTLGFVDYGYMQFSFVADRFQYLAGIGVTAVLIGSAVFGARKLELRGTLKVCAQVGLAVVLALLATLTWRQTGIYKDQITLFRHIVTLNPNARDAHLNLGSALLESGRTEEGLASSLIAAQQRPDNPGGYTNVGRAMLMLGRVDEAEKYLRRALAVNPRHKESLQNIAEVFRRQSNYEEALETYRKILQRHPNYALAHAGIGHTLFDLEQYQAAVEQITLAISLGLDPSMAGALHVRAGQALRKLDRLRAAENHFRRAMILNPQDLRPIMELGDLRVSQQRLEEAQEYFNRARELQPESAAALHNMASTLRKQNQFAQALELYAEALDLDPDFSMAHAGMSDALLNLKRYEEAIESMRKAIALDPESRTTSDRYLLIGQAFLRLERTEEAATHFELAVDAGPSNAAALDHLAMSRFGQKRYEEALKLYESMLELDSDRAQVLANQATTLYSLGRFGEALESGERALSLNPDLSQAAEIVAMTREILAK